jgi:hypothetical protein
MPIHIHEALENYSIHIERLMKIIYQCVQWREKLAQINQLYFVISFLLSNEKESSCVLFADKNRTNSSPNKIIINKK